MNTPLATFSGTPSASARVAHREPADAPAPSSAGNPPSAVGQRNAQRRSPAVPAQQRDAFESALRRHGQDDDEHPAPGPAAAMPWGPALPPASPAPAPAAQEPPSGAGVAGAPPRTAAAQDGVSTHLRALGSSSASACASASAWGNVSAHSAVLAAGGTDAIASHWQMQWAGATSPVQSVDLRRSDTGTLQLDMTGHAHASDPARLARLRDRVAAHAPAGQVLVRGHLWGPSSGAQRHPGGKGPLPFDDEGDVA
jgi:hypothetical protein